MGNPYQVGRVWQSFDLARDLERVHGVPWATELSPMTGGSSPAPFVQEFPLAQYGAVVLRAATGITIPAAGQAVALLIALASAAVWLLYTWCLPVARPQRMAAGALIFFVPGFLRYGATAVPDALVFLVNLSGACLIFTGRRRQRTGVVTLGAILIGAAVLVKATALLPAAVIALAFLAERRWRPAIALMGASLPGLVWAAMARSINEASLPVNVFARVGNLREYWWNPHLYFDPWWYRTLAFTLYDVLGLLGLVCVCLAMTGRRGLNVRFERAVLFAPAAATIVAFPYHSATHGYYSLTWLAFTVIASMELAAKTRRLSAAWTVGFAIALGVLGLMERQIGVVERMIAQNPDAVVPLVHLHRPPPDRREQQAHAALLDWTKRASLIAYLGSSGAPFLQSGIRGWIGRGPGFGPQTRAAPASARVRCSGRGMAETERRLVSRSSRTRVGRCLDRARRTAGSARRSPVGQYRRIVRFARASGRIYSTVAAAVDPASILRSPSAPHGV